MKAEKNPNVLFLTSISPFPINGGEKLRSYALMKMLSNIGAKVTAVINESHTIPDITNIRFIQFPFKKYLSNFKQVIAFYKSSACRIMIFYTIRQLNLKSSDFLFLRGGVN